MICFNCDYLEGAHPEILKALSAVNFAQTPAYGEDEHCRRAARLIAAACEVPCAAHFLVGGTQTNLTVIAAALKPYQAVIAAHTGHINVHETGAIEATGHKVLTARAESDGKLTPALIQAVWDAHSGPHMVQPAMVYLSDSTENGAVYTRAELYAISALCKKLGLLLYLDGARLGYALASPANDLTLADIARCCDAFSIGGTKVGALFGEAVVLTRDTLNKDFRYMIKRQGAMLAKGWLLGLQFETLFTDRLYFSIARRAVEQALRIADALQSRGVDFLTEPVSNQIFPLLPNPALKTLSQSYLFEIWAPGHDGKTPVRICTSWATTDAHVDELIGDLGRLLPAAKG
jgi:threonine aldolase